MPANGESLEVNFPQVYPASSDKLLLESALSIHLEFTGHKFCQKSQLLLLPQFCPDPGISDTRSFGQPAPQSAGNGFIRCIVDQLSGGLSSLIRQPALHNIPRLACPVDPDRKPLLTPCEYPCPPGRQFENGRTAHPPVGDQQRPLRLQVTIHHFDNGLRHRNSQKPLDPVIFNIECK